MSEHEKNRIVIVSVVNQRDGAGIEVYRNEDLVVDIFRDDRQKTRMVTIYKPAIALEEIEEMIAVFKKEIPWNFID